MITGLDHANICTDDLEATRAFYVDLLGLEEGFRPNLGSSRGLWLYANQRPILHIILESQARPPGGALDHVAFAVSDFDATLARLDGAGVTYQARDIPDGIGRQAFVKDPSGVTIELNWRRAA